MLSKAAASASEAVSHVRSGHRVFVQGGSATPNALLRALCGRARELRDVEFIHLHTMGDAPHLNPDFRECFRVTNLFVGQNARGVMDLERVDYLPCFLSEIPNLFRSGRKPLDVALLHLSPPDPHGFCTLGTSVDVARAAFESSDLVIAQINQQMPRVHGDAYIPVSELDAYIEIDEALPSTAPGPLNDVERAIGRHVSALVEDGACLQIGIGAVPDAVLAALTGHRNLGVHTELWSDGTLALLRSGAVDNSRKTVHPGKTVSGFIIGSKAVYDYIDDNPSVIQLGIDTVNDPSVISRNTRVTAINSAVEIDLTGQVCADSIGHRIISGVGGQMDFMRGASLSEGGKAIIALPSRTHSGVSRIASSLRPGAGVVTTRAHVHFVVTEYGAVDLYGKTLNDRARSLIGIAHPQDREKLTREWHSIQTAY